MRTNLLLSPEEAAGYALAITEEMAADQDAQCEAAEAAQRWTGQERPLQSTAPVGDLSSWLPDWVAQYWRQGRATA